MNTKNLITKLALAGMLTLASGEVANLTHVMPTQTVQAKTRHHRARRVRRTRRRVVRRSRARRMSNSYKPSFGKFVNAPSLNSLKHDQRFNSDNFDDAMKYYPNIVNNSVMAKAYPTFVAAHWTENLPNPSDVQYALNHLSQVITWYKKPVKTFGYGNSFYQMTNQNFEDRNDVMEGYVFGSIKIGQRYYNIVATSGGNDVGFETSQMLNRPKVKYVTTNNIKTYTMGDQDISQSLDMDDSNVEPFEASTLEKGAYLVYSPSAQPITLRNGDTGKYEAFIPVRNWDSVENADVLIKKSDFDKLSSKFPHKVMNRKGVKLWNKNGYLYINRASMDNGDHYLTSSQERRLFMNQKAQAKRERTLKANLKNFLGSIR